MALRLRDRPARSVCEMVLRDEGNGDKAVTSAAAIFEASFNPLPPPARAATAP